MKKIFIKGTMPFSKDMKKLIEGLKVDMAACLNEDQFGYAKIDAYDVYKRVIKQLERIWIKER